MDTLATDVLVIGGGAAGFRAAYEAKRHFPSLRVTLATYGRVGRAGSTSMVASESLGINAPLDLTQDGDSPDVFLADMLDTGAGLADPALCRLVADESGERVRELMALGVHFDDDGQPRQRRLSGCSHARSLAVGGATGKAMLRALSAACRGLSVELLEGVRATGVMSRDGRVCGLFALQGRRRLQILATSTVLATGGAGRLFAMNVNTPGTQGDGWAMALRAGARLTNLEFIQIGPGLVWPPIPFIIHSGLWRLGPTLRNGRGDTFLQRYCPSGVDAADVLVAKADSYPFSVRTPAMYLDIAIFHELAQGRGTPHGGVYFDLTHVPSRLTLETSPHTCNALNAAGVDLSRQVIEIAPLVQNFTGGILIDAQGFTGCEGLWAAGEVSGGVHGADRPGGNNLADTQVFGYRAGVAAAQAASAMPRPKRREDELETNLPTGGERQQAAVLQRLCSQHLSIVRDQAGVEKVVEHIAELRRDAPRSLSLSFSNRLLASEAIASSARARTESRGTHFRADFPTRDDALAHPFIVSLDPGGQLSVN